VTIALSSEVGRNHLGCGRVKAELRDKSRHDSLPQLLPESRNITFLCAMAIAPAQHEALSLVGSRAVKCCCEQQNEVQLKTVKHGASGKRNAAARGRRKKPPAGGVREGGRSSAGDDGSFRAAQTSIISAGQRARPPRRGCCPAPRNQRRTLRLTVRSRRERSIRHIRRRFCGLRKRGGMVICPSHRPDLRGRFVDRQRK
jgi:hypothetical protein